jgi:hypothetical protein
MPQRPASRKRFDPTDQALVRRQLPAELGPADVSPCGRVPHDGKEPLEQLPRVGVEVAENGESVPWPISFGLLDGFQFMTGWHKDRSNEKGVRNAIRIFKHDRLKLRLVEIDANSLGDLAVEARIAARSFAKNVNRFGRTECRSAGTVSLTSVPLS